MIEFGRESEEGKQGLDRRERTQKESVEPENRFKVEFKEMNPLQLEEKWNQSTRKMKVRRHICSCHYTRKVLWSWQLMDGRCFCLPGWPRSHMGLCPCDVTTSGQSALKFSPMLGFTPCGRKRLTEWAGLPHGVSWPRLTWPGYWKMINWVTTMTAHDPRAAQSTSVS